LLPENVSDSGEAKVSLFLLQQVEQDGQGPGAEQGRDENGAGDQVWTRAATQ
jgi:hypothetical protein